MNDQQLEEIRQRYTTVPQMRYTTIAINEQWAQCQRDVNALLAEVERLRDSLEMLVGERWKTL